MERKDPFGIQNVNTKKMLKIKKEQTKICIGIIFLRNVTEINL